MYVSGDLKNDLKKCTKTTQRCGGWQKLQKRFYFSHASGFYTIYMPFHKSGSLIEGCLIFITNSYPSLNDSSTYDTFPQTYFFLPTGNGFLYVLRNFSKTLFINQNLVTLFTLKSTWLGILSFSPSHIILLWLFETVLYFVK